MKIIVVLSVVFEKITCIPTVFANYVLYIGWTT